MMMCIGGSADFEAQMLASVEHYSKWRSAADLELAERSATWLRARKHADFGWGLGLCLRRVEPPRPDSYGRRFIPAWLASERERCMGEEHVLGSRETIYRSRSAEFVRLWKDTSVLVLPITRPV